MLHYEIQIPKDNSVQIMETFGEMGNSIEFEDLNKDTIETQKEYYLMINRCDEIEIIFQHLSETFLDYFNIKLDEYHNFNQYKKHLLENFKNIEEPWKK